MIALLEPASLKLAFLIVIKIISVPDLPEHKIQIKGSGNGDSQILSHSRF